MKKISLIIVVFTFVSFLSCKEEKKENTTDVKKTEEVIDTKNETTEKTKRNIDKKQVVVYLQSKSGSEAKGSLILKESNGMVYMASKFFGLAPGTHAIHIHEKADCTSPDGKSAGGHWNPTFQDHGKWGDENGYHKGDIGNFEVDEQGQGKLDFKTDEWCIGCGDEKKDILGKAIIVHQGADDMVSQPSGAAGARVSCGGIIQ